MALQVWLPLDGDLRNQGLSNVTITNANSTFDLNGKIGQAMKNTADGQGIVLTNFMNTLSTYTNYSICAWVYLTASASNHSATIMSSGNWNTGNGQFCFGFYNFSNNKYTNIIVPNKTSWSNGITVSGGIALNTWYHVCVTSNGSLSTVYLNGVNIGTTSYQGITAQSETANLKIGAATYYDGFTLKGKINDVRIYDHCLSPKEVEEIAKGLVLHYKLDDEYCEGTTNLVPTPSDFSDSGWQPYTNGYTSISDNEFGCKSIIVTAKKPWCGIRYLNIPLPATGTYTLSVYCKPLSRSSTSINQTLYTNGGGYSSDQAVGVSWDRVGEWQRISMTRTFTTTSISLFLIAYGGSQSTDTVSCEWTMPQIEAKDHTTPFVNGTHTPTTVYDSSGYNHNGTISNGSLTMIHNSPRYSYCTYLDGTGPYIDSNTNLSFLTNNSPFTISFWAYCADWTTATTSSSKFLLQSYHTSYGGFRIYSSKETNRYRMYWLDETSTAQVCYFSNNNTLTSGWYLFTTTYDGTTFRTYLNGNSYTSKVSTYIHTTSAPHFCIGTGTATVAGNYSDFRIYATALTAAQVKDLYNTSMSISSNGSIFARELVES